MGIIRFVRQLLFGRETNVDEAGRELAQTRAANIDAIRKVSRELDKISPSDDFDVAISKIHQVMNEIR